MGIQAYTSVLRLALEQRNEMTKTSWDAIAGNLTDMAEERRASAEFYTSVFKVSAVLTTLGGVALGAIGQWTGKGIGEMSHSPLMLPIGFTGTLTLVGLLGRQWEIRAANQYDTDAAIASTQSTCTHQAKGCGLLTWLFFMLFGTPRKAERYGHEFVGGARRA